MKTLVFLTGLRGSGKSTVLGRIKNYGRVLQPSTTRAKRSKDDDEYHFVSADMWDAQELAWSISVNARHYGMRMAEIEAIPDGGVGLTVFAPGSLEELLRALKNLAVRPLIIGLDTVPDLETLKQRTNGDPSRSVSPGTFAAEREAIAKHSDIVVHGDLNQVVDAVVQCLTCAQFPGSLPDRAIKALGTAAYLLEPFDPKAVQPASYDLHLGDEYWCQGKKGVLSENDSTLKIPAYSYVLVTAREQARLPRFIHARFDLKVSLFFNGIILSNGPQVDPGYSGNLFCLLLNCSDRPVHLYRGSHFSTIEFHSTAAACEAGYAATYQFKTKIDEFMTEFAVTGPGGTIEDRFTDISNKQKQNFWTSLAPSIAIGAVIATTGIALVTWSLSLNSKVSDLAVSARQALVETQSARESIRTDVTAAQAAANDTRQIDSDIRKRLTALCGGDDDASRCDATIEAVIRNGAKKK